jgi:hypothetical protein
MNVYDPRAVRQSYCETLLARTKQHAAAKRRQEAETDAVREEALRKTLNMARKSEK